jgi:hypothetical protein
MVRTAVGCFVIMAALAALPASATDVQVSPAPRTVVTVMPPTVIPAPPEPAAIATGPLREAPDVHYGCQRLWRCDSIVCEWRRGCWGVYGYMEGPYYTLELAKRQWEHDGWPMSTRRRHRSKK